MNDNTLVCYVRDEERVPVATMVSVPKGDKYSIGYAVCNDKDTFNKKQGVFIASQRAENRPPSLEKILSHQKIKLSNVQYFLGRCERFYKNKTLFNQTTEG